MWATCNTSIVIVVIDANTHAIKARIPMPNVGDSHGGVFVAYTRGANGVTAEVVSDQNGLQGSALAAALKSTPWAVAGQWEFMPAQQVLAETPPTPAYATPPHARRPRT